MLEVIQTSEDMVFAQLVDILSEELERCNLYTVDDIQRAQLHKKAPELLATSASTSKAEHSTHVSTSRNGSSNGSPKSIHNETGLPEVLVVGSFAARQLCKQWLSLCHAMLHSFTCFPPVCLCMLQLFVCCT